MGTALIILSIAFGLKKLGVNLPFIDKTIDFINTKKAKNVSHPSKSLEYPTKIKIKPDLNAKLYNNNTTFKAHTYPRTNIYSGSLKI